MDELIKLPVAISGMTWWCLCSPESELKLGCPYEMGGPVNRFGADYFSELGYSDYFLEEHGRPLSDLSDEPNILANQTKKVIGEYIKTPCRMRISSAHAYTQDSGCMFLMIGEENIISFSNFLCPQTVDNKRIVLIRFQYTMEEFVQACRHSLYVIPDR